MKITNECEKNQIGEETESRSRARGFGKGTSSTRAVSSAKSKRLPAAGGRPLTPEEFFRNPQRRGLPPPPQRRSPPHLRVLLLISPDSCHDLDVKIVATFAVLLALASSAFAADCVKNQPKTEPALIELEQNWAAALSRKDVAAVACMAADEFEEADVDGSLHNRSQMLE